MFIEINSYSGNTYYSDNMSPYDSKRVYLGKCIINTELIKYIHVTHWKWKDIKTSLDINEETKVYSVEYGKDDCIYTDKESYDLIKKAIIKKNSETLKV